MKFKNLIVYQKSKELVKQVYTLLKQFPDDERFALCGQMRRAAISVPSNIVEGMARLSTSLHSWSGNDGWKAKVLNIVGNKWKTRLIKLKRAIIG